MFHDLADELLCAVLSYADAKSALSSIQHVNRRVYSFIQSDQLLWKQYCMSAFPNIIINDPHRNNSIIEQQLNICPSYPHDWKTRYHQSIAYQSIECIQTLSDHKDQVLCIDVSNGGKYLTSISKDCTAILYEQSKDQSTDQPSRWVKRWQIQLPEGYYGTRCTFNEDASYVLYHCPETTEEGSVIIVVGTEHCSLVQAISNYPSDTIGCWMSSISHQSCFTCASVDHHDLITIIPFQIVQSRQSTSQSVRVVQREDLKVYLPVFVNFIWTSQRNKSPDLPITYDMLHDTWLYEDCYQFGVKATRSESAPILVEPSQHPDWECDEGLRWMIYSQSDREKDMIRIKRIKSVDNTDQNVEMSISGPVDEDILDQPNDDDDRPNEDHSKISHTESQSSNQPADQSISHSVNQTTNQPTSQSSSTPCDHDVAEPEADDEDWSSGSDEDEDVHEMDVDQADDTDDITEEERIQFANPDDLTLCIHGRITGMLIVNDDKELLVAVRPFVGGARHRAPPIDIDESDVRADHAVSGALVIHRFALNPFVRLSSVVHPDGFSSAAQQLPWQLPAVNSDDVIVFADSVGGLVLFDTQLHRQLHTFKPHNQFVNVMKWTNNTLITASDDHSIKVWNVKREQLKCSDKMKSDSSTKSDELSLPPHNR